MDNNFLEKSDFASAPLAVYSFEPAAFLINKGAKKLWKNHRKTARFVSALQYLTNPVDRTIQLVVTPLFTTVSFIYTTHAGYGKMPDWYKNSKQAKVGYLVFRATVFLPTVATKTVLIWISLASNTAIHLFPFKVISACRDNRPFNFTARREYQREVIRQYQTNFFAKLQKFSLGIRYLFWSDKGRAKKLASLKWTHSAASRHSDKYSEKYLGLPRTDNVEILIKELKTRDESTLPTNKSQPFDASKTDRESFLKNICVLFHERTIHDDNLSYFEERTGLDSLFFLPKNMTPDEKDAELNRRFAAFLERIEKEKELNLLSDNIKTGFPNMDNTSRKRLLTLEAVFTYTYRELKQRGPATKSAAKE